MIILAIRDYLYFLPQAAKVRQARIFSIRGHILAVRHAAISLQARGAVYEMVAALSK